MRALVTSSLALASAGLLLMPPPARAQTSTWTATIGRDTFKFRDVSRTTRPVDASPVTWRGTGPFALVRYERATRARTHRIEGFLARASEFAYVSPVASDAAARADRATHLAARYEYRRYLLRDLTLRGLDIGAGLEGGATRLSLRHEFGPSLALDESRAGLATAGVMAARLTRWRVLTLDTSWSNGLALAHRHVAHTEAPDPRTGWGGGWTSEWINTARIRLSDAASLVLEHRRVRNVFYAEHATEAVARQSVVAGVSYGR